MTLCRRVPTESSSLSFKNANYTLVLVDRFCNTAGFAPSPNRGLSLQTRKLRAKTGTQVNSLFYSVLILTHVLCIQAFPKIPMVGCGARGPIIPSPVIHSQLKLIYIQTQVKNYLFFEKLINITNLLCAVC